MSRRDLIHFSVRRALEKDRWTITDDPLQIKLKGIIKGYEIDLAAEKFIIAEKGAERIAIEVKSFAGQTTPNSFHTALGQYIDYRDAIEKVGEDRILYLAIGEEIFSALEEIPFLGEQIQKYALNLLVVDIESQTITQWA